MLHLMRLKIFLASFHSKVMTLLTGDIICTGIPRAVRINQGDVVECRIDGFLPLINSVMDLKSRQRQEKPLVRNEEITK